jgi:hypothetical protein
MEESMGIEKYEVPVDKLEWHCDPALFRKAASTIELLKS